MNTAGLKQFSDIQHILYINLHSRTDRDIHVQSELKKLGLIGQRFNAIKLSNSTSGAIGCSMSHLRCLEMAKREKWSHVFICEDDIVFLDPELITSKIDLFLKSSVRRDEWDVLILGGNNMLPYKPVDDTCIQVMHCLTTTGYIVRSHYYDTLIANVKEGIQKLLKYPLDKKLYAIDKYWLHLQMQDKWFLIIPPSVVQREDYSDIENKQTNFQKYMLDYNKCYR